MFYINHEHKAIFIHNPKVAGSYIRKLLQNFFHFEYEELSMTEEEHLEFNENRGIDVINKTMICQCRYKGIRRYIDKVVKKYPDYYKFTFVRNPYSKIISAWAYSMHFSLNNPQKLLHNNEEHVDNYEFDDFLKVGPKECTDYTYFHSFITQTDHLINNENELDFQFIGKYENLKEDLQTVLRNLKFTDFSYLETNEGTNVVNYSIKTNPTSFYLTKENIDFINTYFEKDFLHFHYTKKEGMKEN